ncbi:MAG: hypothetical protein NVS1B11_07190 [Terriglobales bacterium]
MATSKNKRLVVIFQRGGADGLNMVVPYGDDAYYPSRPSINIPRNAVIDLDGFFGLHPALSSFVPIWRERHLAIVHAVGSPHPSRSHFEAQDFMESGTPGVRSTHEGWLNRAARLSPGYEFPHVPTHEPTSAADYPNGYFADNLKKLAQSIKTNLFPQVALADIGGWDHHANQGSTQGNLATLLAEFSQSLAAFWADLSDFHNDTVVVTLSEFGRSARENRTGGTDHGRANTMFVMGGQIKGGNLYGRWPDLAQAQLHGGDALPVTTDFRRVLGEIVYKHLGNRNLAQVFPGFDNQPQGFLNLMV